MPPRISIVIPVFNEAGQLVEKLQALQSCRSQCQLIVVDGGSSDASAAMAESWVDLVIGSLRGRALQMNKGAEQAEAGLLLFLHADTCLPHNAVNLILEAIHNGAQWGRFNVKFDSPRLIFKLIALMMNVRSRLTGIATGDQAIFMTRAVFQRVGGFPEIALMEDIALSTQLKRIGKPACLAAKVTTSARRWQQRGIVKTIILMWRLRLCFYMGVEAKQLAKFYD